MTIVIPDPIQYSVWIALNLCDIRPDARFHPDEEVGILATGMTVKQLQSIAVCRVPDPANPGSWRYEVIFGVGRVLAARKNSWEKVRADIYEGLTEFQKLDMIFSENEDRKNASPLYQAKVLKGMMEAGNLTQDQLAEQIGKTRQNVSQYVGLFNLSPRIWDNANTFAKFGLRHFIQLLRVKNEDDQWKLAEMARDQSLSSPELQAAVDKHLGVKTGAKKEGRPKGDKTVGPNGFAFKRQKGDILIKIKGRFSEENGIAVFLAKAGEAWTQWVSKNPKPKKATASKTDVSGGGAPSSTAVPAPAPSQEVH